MANPTYLSIEEAARKYDVKKGLLIQLIEAGVIQIYQSSTGELLVVADRTRNIPKPQTKEEIISAKFAHLRGHPISASEASRKYSKTYGVPISQPLLSRWAKLGYINVLERGYRLKLDEADVAYCAEIFAKKHKQYGGSMQGVNVFDENGNPYQLKDPEVAQQLRSERRQKKAA